MSRLIVILSLILGLTAQAQTSKYGATLSAALHQSHSAFSRACGDASFGSAFGDAIAKLPLRVMLTTTDADATMAQLRAIGVSATVISPTLVNASLGPVLGDASFDSAFGDAIAKLESIPSITAIELGAPVHQNLVLSREETGIDRMHSGVTPTGSVPQSLTGQGVIVGIVDAGFEYGHAAFFTPEGQYRVRRIWDQGASNGRTPAGFDYGTEYLTPTEMLNAHTDEAGATHGTHVANIAAGSDPSSPYNGVATDAELVLVAIEQAHSTSSYIIDAVKYIFDYAAREGKPCAINISLGSHYGPHDGTSATDRAFDSMTGPGRIIVGSAGNEADLNMHASKTFTAGDTQLKTMFSFSNPTLMRSLIDIWGSQGQDFTVSVVSVDNLKGQIIHQSPAVSSSTDGTTQYNFTTDQSGAVGHCIISVKHDNSNGCPNIYIESEFTYLAANRKLALIIQGTEGSTIHLWNCTGDAFYSNGRPGWTAGDSHCTSSEIGGTARSIITVGAYALRNKFTDLYGDEYTASVIPGQGEIGFFSSQGPTRDGRMKPEVVAPGVLVCSAVSKLHYADRYAMEAISTGHDNSIYYYHPETGTSMSSPLVAGTVACWLQADPTLTPDRVRQILAATSRHDQYTGPTSGNVYGYGKLDAYAGAHMALTGELPEGIIAPHRLPASHQSSILYDLQGRRLTTPRGLYIQNRKVRQ